jgi:hypothetical protein
MNSITTTVSAKTSRGIVVSILPLIDKTNRVSNEIITTFMGEQFILIRPTNSTLAVPIIFEHQKFIDKFEYFISNIKNLILLAQKLR